LLRLQNDLDRYRCVFYVHPFTIVKLQTTGTYHTNSALVVVCGLLIGAWLQPRTLSSFPTRINDVDLVIVIMVQKQKAMSERPRMIIFCSARFTKVRTSTVLEALVLESVLPVHVLLNKEHISRRHHVLVVGHNSNTPPRTIFSLFAIDTQRKAVMYYGVRNRKKAKNDKT
jgi:hypothetical protein